MITSLVLIAALLQPVAAIAFVPLLIPFIASAVLHVSVAAVGLYYAMRPNVPTIMDSQGNLYRKSGATWVDLKGSPPAVKTQNVTAKMDYAKVGTLASKMVANDKTYPQMYEATHKSITLITASTPVGAGILPYAGATHGQYVTSKEVGSAQPCQTPMSDYNWHISNAVQFYYAEPGYPGLCRTTVFGLDNSNLPPVRVATLPEYQTAVAANLLDPSPNAVKSALQSELDKMFQDPDYVPTFTDDTTGLPYAPPLRVLLARRMKWQSIIMTGH